MSSVTIVKFRTDFPEFTANPPYTDPSIQFYLDLADLLVGPRWKTLATFGIELFVAHNLCLEFDAWYAANKGQNPGRVVGQQTGGTVDKVSYTRASFAMDPKNGHWSLTTYGLRYIRLVQMVGAGPVQVGVGCGGGPGAWPGPWYANFPNPSC
jgi:hypothetical protein